MEVMKLKSDTLPSFETQALDLPLLLAAVK